MEAPPVEAPPVEAPPVEAPPVTPVVGAPRPRGKKAAVVKRSRCNKRRDDIPLKYKRKLVALFEAQYPGPFEGPMAVKKAIGGSKFLRVLQEALHKASSGRCKLHNIEQFSAWLGKDLRGSKCRSKRKNISGEHHDIETLTFAYYQGVVSGSRRCTKAMLEDFAEKALRKKLENTTATFGHTWSRRFMKRHGIRERIVKRQVKLSDTEALAEVQKFHDHLQSVLATGQVKWVVNTDQIPASLCGSMGKIRAVTSSAEQNVLFDASDTKRCCSVMPFACVDSLGTPHTLKTRILLKGTPPAASPLRKEVHPNSVSVHWTPKACINGSTMIEIVKDLIKEMSTVNVPGVYGILILDRANAHITAELDKLCKVNNIIIANVPGGCTAMIQWVDTHFAAIFKSWQRRAYDRQPQIKRTAKMKRALLGELVQEAVKHGMDELDVPKNFKDLGYFNPAEARLRALPAYKWVDPQYEVMEARKRQEEKVAEARLEGERVVKPILPKGQKSLDMFGFKKAERAPPVVVVPHPEVLPLPKLAEAVTNTKPSLAGRNLGVIDGAAAVGGPVKRAGTGAEANAKRVKKHTQKPAMQPAQRPFNPPAKVMPILPDFEEDIVVDEDAEEEKKREPLKLKEQTEFESTCALMKAHIKNVPPDGNCLFHALAMTCVGTGDFRTLRNVAADEIQENPAFYQTYMADDPNERHAGDETSHLPTYCTGVRANKYGGELELRALSNALHVTIHVYECTGRRSGAFVPDGKMNFPVVTLSFHKYLWKAPHYQIIEYD